MKKGCVRASAVVVSLCNEHHMLPDYSDEIGQGPDTHSANVGAGYTFIHLPEGVGCLLLYPPPCFTPPARIPGVSSGGDICDNGVGGDAELESVQAQEYRSTRTMTCTSISLNADSCALASRSAVATPGNFFMNL